MHDSSASQHPPPAAEGGMSRHPASSTAVVDIDGCLAAGNVSPSHNAPCACAVAAVGAILPL